MQNAWRRAESFRSESVPSVCVSTLAMAGAAGYLGTGRLVAVKLLIANGVFTDAEFKDQPSDWPC